MRVVLLSETFTVGMGYLENMLPKYLARLGAETHVVATDLHCSYRQTDSQEAYSGFVEPLPSGYVGLLDGFTLHILGHSARFGHMRVAGLLKKLRAIRPDIVQTSTATGWIALDAALIKAAVGYRLFTGSHHHASVFPLAKRQVSPLSAERLKCWAARTIPGRLASLGMEKCYAISPDCAEVAARFFGVPSGKLEVCPLGVDTELFHRAGNSAESAERTKLRRKFRFDDGDIVCIYSGRFSDDKNPLVLARAVAGLCRRGEPYRGLFVGNGAQAAEIVRSSGCVIHPFVRVEELGSLYRAADIGVWPTQESLSMLDAAACGLPIVANHTITANERVDGNGLSYRLNDTEDLQKVLLALRSPAIREAMGARGALKMAREFSWEAIARRRLQDYQTALNPGELFREHHASKELVRGPN